MVATDAVLFAGLVSMVPVNGARLKVLVTTVATAKAALRTLRGLGGLHADACRQLGAALPGAMAQVGDVVLLRLPRSRGRTAYALGVCLGALCAAPASGGLLMLPITEAEASWRV